MDLLFVQKIVHKRTGEEFDLGMLNEFTLVETINLDGPKVIMKMNDNYLYLQDNLQIKAEDDLTITLSDMFSSDQMDAVNDFTILSCPEASGNMVINCMASAVYSTKKPVEKSKLFPVGDPSTMINSFIGGFKMDLPKMPVTEAYHVLAGERPSYALRQMAKEQGGHIFFDRGKIVVKRIDDLLKKEPDFTYIGGDNREEMQVLSYQVKKPEQQLKDKLVRSYSSFSITDGFVNSDKNSGGVPQMYGSPAGPVLNSINSVPFPVIDFTVKGNGGIRAGSVIAFEWKTRRQDAPLNEALPEKVVVSAVAHYYGSGKYMCRCKGSIALNGE